MLFLSTTIFLYFINISKESAPTEAQVDKFLQAYPEGKTDNNHQKVISELKAENAELLKKVAQLQAERYQRADAQSGAHDENNVDEVVKPNEVVAKADFEKIKDQQIGKYENYKGKTAEEIVESRTLRFSEEPIDEEWSSQYENKLESLIQNNEMLSQYAIQELQCRSERCRITVYVGLQANAQDFSSHLISELVQNQNSPDSQTGVFHDYSQEDGVATYYIGRNSEVPLF